MQSNRRARQYISEVGESHHTLIPTKTSVEVRRPSTKRYCLERSPEPTKHTVHHKRTRSIEIEPFTKWIHGVAPDPSLKISQIFLYLGQSHQLEHICRYKSTMRLVTNNETNLCKAFSSTLANKTLTCSLH